MTFCAVFCHADTAFFVGDSAITGLPGLVSKTSTFGELQDRGTTEHVQEALLKIFPIGARGALAYSGSVRNAVDFIKTVRVLVEVDQPLPDAIKRCASDLQLKDELDHFELLGAFVEAERVRTFYWASKDAGNLVFDIVYATIGSLSADHLSLVDGSVKNLHAAASDAMDPSMVLPSWLGNLQAMGVHAALLDEGVGGAFVGAMVSVGHGFSWQDDITYILCPPTGASVFPRIVTVAVREDVAAVMSFYEGKAFPAVLPHEVVWLADATDWQQRWWSSLFREVFKGLQCRFFVMLSVSERKVIVIRSSERSPKSKWLQIHLDAGIAICPHPDVARILQTPISGPDAGRTVLTVCLAD